MNYVHYLGFINKRADLSFEAFDRHWQTTHTDLVLASQDPGPIVGYTQNVRTASDRIDSDFDGAPELWIRDDEAVAALFASETFQEAYHLDSPKFVQPDVTSFFIRDRVVVDAAANPGDFRLIRVIERPRSADALGEHDRWWQDSEAPLFFREGPPRRLVRSRIASAEAVGVDAAAFYGIESSWWPDEQALLAAWNARDVSKASERKLIARERIQLSLR